MQRCVIVNTEVTDEDRYAEFTRRIVDVVATYGSSRCSRPRLEAEGA